MKDKNVDIIETYVMFSTDVTINLKMRKVSRYGSLQPEYELVEVAGVGIDEINDDAIRIIVLEKIRIEALRLIKKYESEIKT